MNILKHSHPACPEEKKFQHLQLKTGNRMGKQFCTAPLHTRGEKQLSARLAGAGNIQPIQCCLPSLNVTRCSNHKEAPPQRMIQPKSLARTEK